MSNETKEQQIESIMELLNAPVEPLHPDLQRHMVDTGVFGPMLKHPLVFAMFMHEKEHARLNAHYEYKRRALADAIKARKWNTAVFLHERPYRLDAFAAIAHNMTDEEYWSLLGRIWTDSENIYENRWEWEDLLTCERPDRHHIMSDEEQELLAMLPETDIPVYRGYREEGGEDGLSWTLFKARARWFAKRFHNEGDDTCPRIVSGTVNRDQVIAHFTNRDEMEIVVLPEHVNNWKVEEV
ncbi:hypothetical protein PBI_MINILON_124 [Mycobacterium phage MiniLon]|nr:hypothetical protein PBI_MINILON_124 [Mycobacterium phage MiniLon]QOP66583.1 hypothetical protein PBI_MINIMAC_124 [Mycobacterium phage MiniMac]